MAGSFVYVSNAVDGTIGAYAMNPDSGALTAIATVAAGQQVMAMAASPDGRHLYAVVRSQPYRVLTLAIEPGTGRLSEAAVAPLPDSMAYAATDRTGRTLFTASYGGSRVAVSRIEANGCIEAAAIQVIPTGRNAHAILPDRSNRFVYATSLGSDRVEQFVLEPATGRLTPNTPATVAVRPGHGPRHPAVSADNRFLYVLAELSGDVVQFAIDPSRGTLSEIDSVASVPAAAGLAPGVPQAPVGQPGAPTPAAGDQRRIWAADIAISPNGRFLYTTERTSSTIALFHVAAATGRLTYVTGIATEAQPRGIRIAPGGAFLVASGEKSDRLAVYAIDPASGGLTGVGRFPAGNGANWVEIVEAA